MKQYETEKVSVGLFKLVAGTVAEPDFSWPLHEKPCRIEVRHHSDRTMSISNQHVILKFKIAAPFGYVYSIYRKNSENLYGEFRGSPTKRGQTFFINIRNAILRRG